MQITPVLAAGSLALFASGAVASEPAGYAQIFVDAFEDACVPGRLGYASTNETALAAGWQVVDRTDHAELAMVMQKADAAVAADDDFEMDFVGELYARDFGGLRHHLSVTEARFVVQDGDDPWVMVGCHLYSFDATAPIDPAPLTALIGNPISKSIDVDGLVGHVWGPPCPMPRTGDTYLSFVADGSATADAVGFSGLSLNFSTSTPDAGEVVPETYCQGLIQ